MSACHQVVDNFLQKIAWLKSTCYILSFDIDNIGVVYIYMCMHATSKNPKNSYFGQNSHFGGVFKLRACTYKCTPPRCYLYQRKGYNMYFSAMQLNCWRWAIFSEESSGMKRLGRQCWRRMSLKRTRRKSSPRRSCATRSRGIDMCRISRPTKCMRSGMR